MPPNMPKDWTCAGWCRSVCPGRRAGRWWFWPWAPGWVLCPNTGARAFLQKKADEQNIKEVGKRLADLTRRNLEKRPPALEPTQKALEAVTDLGDQLTKKTFTRSEALKDLANVAEKLKDELKEMGKDPALRKMEQAARASTGNDAQTAAGLQKQIEALQKQMGTPTGNPDALDKLKKDLEKLQEAAKGMASKNTPGSEAERQKLSESLSALSKQMQDMGLQLPQLDDAIKALEANQTDLVLKDLEASLTDLEKMRDMAKSLQQLQQQAEKLGKDLAEQLKNGQPEARPGDAAEDGLAIAVGQSLPEPAPEDSAGGVQGGRSGRQLRQGGRPFEERRQADAGGEQARRRRRRWRRRPRNWRT